MKDFFDKYGMSQSQLEATINDNPVNKKGQVLQLIADAQEAIKIMENSSDLDFEIDEAELIASGGEKRINQLLNRAKYIISKYLTDDNETGYAYISSGR